MSFWCHNILSYVTREGMTPRAEQKSNSPATQREFQEPIKVVTEHQELSYRHISVPLRLPIAPLLFSPYLSLRGSLTAAKEFLSPFSDRVLHLCNEGFPIDNELQLFPSFGANCDHLNVEFCTRLCAHFTRRKLRIPQFRVTFSY